MGAKTSRLKGRNTLLISPLVVLFLLASVISGWSWSLFHIYGSDDILSETILYENNHQNVIYFTHGFDCKQLNAVPYAHYFLSELGESGQWDVIVADFRGQHCPIPYMHQRTGAQVARRVAELKNRGYKRVVIGGQSGGGWAALIAAQDPSLPADALLLIAPACCGTETNTDGSYNPYFRQTYTDYMRLLRNVRVPVVAAFFNKDRFDPGGRVDASNEILGQNNIPHLVIDTGGGLFGHGAGWLPAFDYMYGECIRDFLDNPHDMGCIPSKLVPNDFRTITNLKQIQSGKAKMMDHNDLSGLVGHKYTIYSADGGAHQETFLSDSTIRRVSYRDNSTVNKIIFYENQYCYEKIQEDRCRYLVKMSNKRIIAFNIKDGSVTSWWVLEN